MRNCQVQNMRNAVAADLRGDVRAWHRAMRRWLIFMVGIPTWIEVSPTLYQRLQAEAIGLSDFISPELTDWDHGVQFCRTTVKAVYEDDLPFADPIFETHHCA